MQQMGPGSNDHFLIDQIGIKTSLYNLLANYKLLKNSLDPIPCVGIQCIL